VAAVARRRREPARHRHVVAQGDRADALDPGQQVRLQAAPQLRRVPLRRHGGASVLVLGDEQRLGLRQPSLELLRHRRLVAIGERVRTQELQHPRAHGQLPRQHAIHGQSSCVRGRLSVTRRASENTSWRGQPRRRPIRRSGQCHRLTSA
jgi:hypothetical protein